MKRAYRTTWGGITSIVAAKDRSQARARTWKSAEEAGYRCVYTDIRVLSRALAKAKRLMEKYPRTCGLHIIACRCSDVMDEYVRRHRKEKVKR